MQNSVRRLAAFFALTSALSALAGARGERLRCEHLEDPLGIEVAKPRLSWILDSTERGQKQTAYQILVAGSEVNLKQDSGDLWDSGKVPSDQTAFITYGGKPLASRQECFWKVRAWDKDDKPSAWSEPATRAVGLLDAHDC